MGIQRRWFIVLCCCAAPFVAVVSLSLNSTPLLARATGHSTGPIPRHHARPFIRGADDPSSIPDDLAFHFLLRSIAKEGRDTQSVRFSSFARHLGFSTVNDEDFQRLLQIARQYEYQLEAASPNGAAFVTARSELVSRARQSMGIHISSERLRLLNSYITTEVKQRISISQ